MYLCLIFKKIDNFVLKLSLLTFDILLNALFLQMTTITLILKLTIVLDVIVLNPVVGNRSMMHMIWYSESSSQFE